MAVSRNLRKLVRSITGIRSCLQCLVSEMLAMGEKVMSVRLSVALSSCAYFVLILRLTTPLSTLGILRFRIVVMVSSRHLHHKTTSRNSKRFLLYSDEILYDEDIVSEKRTDSRGKQTQG